MLLEYEMEDEIGREWSTNGSPYTIIALQLEESVYLREQGKVQ
jgi:hypothetical protein